MKIALVSTGLGRVLRGFESFTESLFQALRGHAPEIDVTLFQGGGKAGERRLLIPNFHRHDPPGRWMGYEKGNLLEKRSFALALYPFLRKGKFDIVHYNELVMGSALCHLRRFLGGNYKLLYCGGSTWSPAHYGHRCDYAQLLTGPMYEDALAFGIPESRVFLIPYGLDVKQFSPNSRADRAAVRAELRIPDDARVVLTVATLDRETKRIDYLIRELSRLDQPVLLLAAGQKTPDTPGLEQEADHLLAGRWRFVSWPQERVHLLYGAADIFVLTSLVEAFGRVIIEALLTGLPAIIQDGPVFKWVAEGSLAETIDMSVEGRLTDALIRLFQRRTNGNSRSIVVSRFGWDKLIPQYVDMYERIISS
jgi:glycosyltransferase involved in cell wall biosynthesis